MAGEWIPVDIAIGQKPEILELCEIADVGVEVAVYRVFSLWAWFSLNSADGAARATPSRLARVCGGDAEFWKAVESVGWLEFDEGEGTASIPGWEDRFSAGAKARASHAKNQRKYREKQQSDASVTVDSHKSDTASSPEERRREEKKREEKRISSSSARDENWERLKAAWQAGTGKHWSPQHPPEEISARLAEAGWLDAALEAIQRLPRCRWFNTPPTLYQFGKADFVQKINAGVFDDQQRSRNDPAEPPKPPDNSRRKYWRGDAQQNLTDGEYAVWKATNRQGVA